MQPERKETERNAADTSRMAQAGIKAFFRVMERWGVKSQEALVLLGAPAKATFYNWKKGRVSRLPHDTLTRISYILGIYKALQVLYADESMADAWVRQPNSFFAGQTALERMLAGEVTDLAAVRKRLDAVRGGW